MTRQRLSALVCVQTPPPVTDLMVRPMPTDDDSGDVRGKELKAALVGCRMGRGGVKEVTSEITHNKIKVHIF